jgi:hypothetical protein
LIRFDLDAKTCFFDESEVSEEMFERKEKLEKGKGGRSLLYIQQIHKEVV